jgi:hypothetical protein
MNWFMPASMYGSSTLWNASLEAQGSISVLGAH